MNSPSLRTIDVVDRVDSNIKLPPSKSYTNRALIAAALADGPTSIVGPSGSEDSEYMIGALREFGVEINHHQDRLEISGTNGRLTAPGREIFVGNAGTAMRFLSTFAALAPGPTVLVGDEQMNRRPMGGLLEALKAAGVRCSSRNGSPPITIQGGRFQGGPVFIQGTTSSQFISSILLSSPYARTPVRLSVRGRMRSLPYLDMTLHVMRTFGANVSVFEPQIYAVNTTERYIGQEYHVEGDASASTYFFAAAAITGGRVRVSNLSPLSLQGDLRFVEILREMGCSIVKRDDDIEVRGTRLEGIEVDMNDLPDCVPTLAVVAAFAAGPTTILNAGHLRFKESDRLRGLETELTKIGARVKTSDEEMTITPGPMRGAVIETYNDHRMAMSFAVAGLRLEGIAITNPSCVAKSFPGFWEIFSQLSRRST